MNASEPIPNRRSSSYSTIGGPFKLFNHPSKSSFTKSYRSLKVDITFSSLIFYCLSLQSNTPALTDPFFHGENLRYYKDNAHWQELCIENGSILILDQPRHRPSLLGGSSYGIHLEINAVRKEPKTEL